MTDKKVSVWTLLGFWLIMGTPLWVALVLIGAIWYSVEHPQREILECVVTGPGTSTCVKHWVEGP